MGLCVLVILCRFGCFNEHLGVLCFIVICVFVAFVVLLFCFPGLIILVFVW